MKVEDKLVLDNYRQLTNKIVFMSDDNLEIAVELAKIVRQAVKKSFRAAISMPQSK